MKLIIARHGEADNNMNDSHRELTDLGRKDIQNMCKIIQGTGWNIAEIRTSPVLRAKQTAEIIAESVQFEKSEIITENILSPGVVLDEAAGLLDVPSNSKAAVWVFHAPDVSRIASMLTDIPDSRFYFPPGTMVAMNLALPKPQGRAMMVWTLQPEFMRDM